MEDQGHTDEAQGHQAQKRLEDEREDRPRRFLEHLPQTMLAGIFFGIQYLIGEAWF